MEWKTLTRKNAEEEFKKYFENKKIELDPKYESLRIELCNGYNLAKRRAEEKAKAERNRKEKYYLDIYFGAQLYTTLQKYNFDYFDASDDGIWRYLSLCVIPDVVEERWGENKDRFYFIKIRVWLRFIWFCIHMAYYKSIEETLDILEPLNSDVVVQFIERNNGKQGYRVDLIKYIFWYFKKLHNNEIPRFRKLQKGVSINMDISRSIAKLNTLRCNTIEPTLYEGGIKGYVNDLFETIRTKFE